MLHNRYDIRGGEDESTDLEVDLLRSKGHDVCLLEARNDAIGKTVSRFQAARNAFWSRKWHDEVSRTLANSRFDLMHVQNFFPLISPSVYYAADSAGVPVFQAVRNYRLMCPSATLFRNGSYCEDCVGKTFKLPAILHRCYRDSLPGTATIAGMSAVHRIGGTWTSKVSRFIAISDYVASKMEQDGLPRNKISVKPNFISRAPFIVRGNFTERHYFLFVGRISVEKGIPFLLESYKRSGLNTPLKIVGEGDMPKEVIPGVEWVGKRSREEVRLLMAGAKAVLLPGQWPEPFGRVAVEAFSTGTPVICTDFGGVAEIVTHGRTGLKIPVGRVDLFAEAMATLANMKTPFDTMARHAYECFESRYNSDTNYDILSSIYSLALR